jgi:hypothetical protein
MTLVSTKPLKRNKMILVTCRGEKCYLMTGGKGKTALREASAISVRDGEHLQEVRFVLPPTVPEIQ